MRRQYLPCPYCKEPVVRVSITGCKVPRTVLRCDPCNAHLNMRKCKWIGGSPWAVVANKEDRSMRGYAHRMVSDIAAVMVERRGCERGEAINVFYAWLALKMRCHHLKAHFGMLVGEQLRRACALVEALHLSVCGGEV